jgi:hypothetical protein
MAEGLLHHHPGPAGQARVGQALDHGAEQERWDLQVEDRGRRLPDGGADALVGGRVTEVAGQVRQPPGEALEHRLLQRLAGRLDRLTGVLAQVLGGPVVDRDANDRAGEQTAALQPVEGAEGHHLGQVAADPEDHQHVRGLLVVVSPLGRRHRQLTSQSGCRAVLLGNVVARYLPHIPPIG